jgi:predicted amidophosphoribosyltransferase
MLRLVYARRTMLPLLWRGALALISAPRCPACGGATAEPPRAVGPAPLCADCFTPLGLPTGGIQGDEPLIWCALGAYAGALRRLLLRQRPRPQPALIAALAVQLHSCCAQAQAGSLLVPIPSWKRSANPLPQLLAAALVEASAGRSRLKADLLVRRRVTVGQHHLNRRQRLGNQRGSFAGVAAGSGLRRAPVWLVDDILTTGATAEAAAEALQEAGWAVQGLLCLARTPGPVPRPL